MKQKIVIEVPLKCEKCRATAMTTATIANGVESVTFERTDRDQVVIIGEGVDATMVTKCLRKKFKYANLISVAKVE